MTGLGYNVLSAAIGTDARRTLVPKFTGIHFLVIRAIREMTRITKGELGGKYIRPMTHTYRKDRMELHWLCFKIHYAAGHAVLVDIC